jgi:hypothetical protein
MRNINKQKYIFALGACLYLLTISFSMHTCILLEIIKYYTIITYIIVFLLLQASVTNLMSALVKVITSRWKGIAVSCSDEFK